MALVTSGEAGAAVSAEVPRNFIAYASTAQGCVVLYPGGGGWMVRWLDKAGMVIEQLDTNHEANARATYQEWAERLMAEDMRQFHERQRLGVKRG